MEGPEQPIRDAIVVIDEFLRVTARDPRDFTVASFRELSQRIALAHSSRARFSSRGSVGAPISTLFVTYRDRLQRLRERLADLETELREQRDRILEEQARITRTREWHLLLTRTQ